MAIPDYQTLMLPVLREFSSGEARIGDVVERLAGSMALPDDELSELLPSGKQTVFSNRVHWAKTYLKQAGLLEPTRRGHFRITPRGEHVLEQEPKKIDNGFLERFPEFLEFKSRKSTELKEKNEAPSRPKEALDTRTPDEIMRAAHQEIEDGLREELLERIVAAPPSFFERLVVKLLVEMGYGGSVAGAGRALGRSGDGGVDGVIDQDALGLEQVYVQAKRYAPEQSVGPGAVRDFFGSLDRFRATKGLFVTTSSFSRDAQETAAHLSKRIVLIDGRTLTGLMVRYNVGCRPEETLYLKKIDEEFFAD